MTIDEHPEKHIEVVYRGTCYDINPRMEEIAVVLDLGFDIHHRVAGKLFNLSLPKLHSDILSESNAAQALYTRINQLVVGKPVLVLSVRLELFKPCSPIYAFCLFYYQPDRDKTWHSLEDQLVREKHAAWSDPLLPVPSVS